MLSVFLTNLALAVNDDELEEIGQQASRSVRGWYMEGAHWLSQHLAFCGTMIVASLIALYGASITKLVARRIRNWPFPARTAVFVLLAGFGFGLMTASAAPWIARLLSMPGKAYLPPVLLAAFIILGILAERSGRI